MMSADLGRLTLRLGLGGTMLVAHGIPKLVGFSQIATMFPDPIGLGPSISLGLAVFAEVFCAAAVILGLLTRWASVPLLITMFVAFVIVHSSDPWGKKELAFIYGVGFFALTCLGSGRFSLDHWILKRRIY